MKENGKILNIAVLYSSLDQSASVLANWFPWDISVYNPFPDRYFFTNIGIHKSTAEKQVTDLVLSKKYDFYICLCYGFSETGDLAGAEVNECLVKMQVPFAGPDTNFVKLSKFDMKTIASLCSIPTPPYTFLFNFNDKEEIALLTKTLKFPLIVKHYNGSDSFGMTERSKVRNNEELVEQVTQTIKAFGGALIEEFISGREYSVLVAQNPNDPNQPIVYEPIECILPSTECFKDYDRKLVNYSTMSWSTIVNRELSEKLKHYTAKMFLACDGNSFARLDFRVSESDEINFLEINAPCDLFYTEENDYGGADHTLKAAGAHLSFVENMIQCGFANLAKRIHGFQISNISGREPQLIATKAFNKGEIIQDFTKLPHSITHEDEIKNWATVKQQLFFKTSIPIGNGFFIWPRFKEALIPIQRNQSGNYTVGENGCAIALKVIHPNDKIIMLTD